LLHSTDAQFRIWKEDNFYLEARESGPSFPSSGENKNACKKYLNSTYTLYRMVLGYTSNLASPKIISFKKAIRSQNSATSDTEHKIIHFLPRLLILRNA
jgi:hypothetical protein